LANSRENKTDEEKMLETAWIDKMFSGQFKDYKTHYDEVCDLSKNLASREGSDY